MGKKFLFLILVVLGVVFLFMSMMLISHSQNKILQEKILTSPKCFIDNDCPSDAPICILQKFQHEDILDGAYICFSEEEGNKIRNEKYQSCLVSMEKKYQDALEKNGKIFDIYDPPVPHKAHLVGGRIFFQPGMINTMNFDPRQVLQDEYQLEITQKNVHSVFSVVFIPLPEGNEIETLCTLKLDNRIYDADFNINWERVNP